MRDRCLRLEVFAHGPLGAYSFEVAVRYEGYADEWYGMEVEGGYYDATQAIPLAKGEWAPVAQAITEKCGKGWAFTCESWNAIAITADEYDTFHGLKATLRF